MSPESCVKVIEAASVLKSAADALAVAAQKAQTRFASNAVLLNGFERRLQLNGYSCGAQSAFMILHYYGKARSIANVTKELDTTEDGTSAESIQELFEKRKLKMNEVATLKELRSALRGGCPILVSLDADNGHWTVVFGYGPGVIYLADPSLKRSVTVKVALATFKERWDEWELVASL